MKINGKMSPSKATSDKKSTIFASSKVRIVNRRNSAADPTTQDSLSWPTEDIRKLLSRMKEHIPQGDQLSHMSRAKSLPWDDIAFDNYTGEECLHMWKLVLQRIRGYRLLSEMLTDAEGWVTKPWSNFYGSKKMNHHPDKPKRPPNASGLYIKEHFDKTKKKNPTLPAKEIFKLLIESYKALSERKRLKYATRANILKTDYHREMEIFLQEHPDQVGSTKKPKPKKLSAFNLYLENELAKQKDSDQPLKDRYSDIRLQWKNLKDTEQLPWIVKAEGLQKEHLAAVIAESHLTKKEKKISDKARGKPEKPSLNKYSLYSKILLNSEEMKQFDPKDRMKQISIKWKTISPEEKAKLEQQVIQHKMDYQLKLEEFYKKYPEEMTGTAKSGINKIKSKKKTPNKEAVNDESRFTARRNHNKRTSADKRLAGLSNKNSDEMFKSKKRKLSTVKLENSKKRPKMETMTETVENSDELPKSKKRKLALNKLENGEESPKLETIDEHEPVEAVKEPKCPPSEPVKYFAKVMKKQKTKYSSEEELMEAWSNLPKKERKMYKRSHAEAMEKYEADYQAYLEAMTPKERKKYLKSKSPA